MKRLPLPRKTVRSEETDESILGEPGGGRVLVQIGGSKLTGEVWAWVRPEAAEHWRIDLWRTRP